MITISNLSHKISGKTVLAHISLQIETGGVTALVGPNGAGKSTLLSLIARLDPIQTGQISVNDLVIGQCDSTQLARTLAILPQAEETAPRLTVRELVAFGRYPYTKGRPTDADRAIVTRALDLFDLHSLSDRQLDTLSGGQRQRAKVAMTYAQDTDYLLLDEPLNNLDLSASRSLMKLLRRLAHDSGKTVIIVLHDINYACAYADQIITLKLGKLGVVGAPADIVTDQLLQDVFETDAQVHHIDGQPLVKV